MSFKIIGVLSLEGVPILSSSCYRVRAEEARELVFEVFDHFMENNCKHLVLRAK